MTSLEAVINRVRSKAANRKSQFVSHAAELDTGLLTGQYRDIRSKAPRRHLKDRKYLFGRSGHPRIGQEQ